MSILSKLQRKSKGFVLRHGPMMLTCEEFEGFILDYLSDRLTPKQKRVFEVHLRICRECQDYLRAYQRTIELEKAVFRTPSTALPAAIPPDLIAAILAARSAD